MKPLIVLLITFLIAMVVMRLVSGIYQPGLSGRIAMSVMLVFTAIGHFAFTKGMTMMVPAAIPYKKGMVYVTGLLEIAGAIGLLLPSCRIAVSWLLILLLVLLLPGNIYAAMHRVDYQKGTFDGPGPSYLWFRIPLQLFFAGWIYWSGVYA